ncbi:MAG TPA: GNAT family N-acetyltransferase, partial [Candidatus Acidoferrum sp.]|nr:GNAT family N-acetyltransferase [Candidatus Acidoferrum sp.]
MFREVRLAALQEAPYAFGSTYERERSAEESNWRERLGNRTQMVAEVGGEIAGTAAGIAADGDPAGGRTAALISMWVAPYARGLGVGARLVNAVVDWAKSEGYDSVFLWVTEGNEVAERLYERCGFLRTGQQQPVHPAEPRLEYEMWKRI